MIDPCDRRVGRRVDVNRPTLEGCIEANLLQIVDFSIYNLQSYILNTFYKVLPFGNLRNAGMSQSLL